MFCLVGVNTERIRIRRYRTVPSITSGFEEMVRIRIRNSVVPGDTRYLPTNLKLGHPSSKVFGTNFVAFERILFTFLEEDLEPDFYADPNHQNCAYTVIA